MGKDPRAEVVGLQALAWVAADEGRLAAFLAATGADIGALRTRAADPSLLAAVLDFVLQDDRTVLAFAAAQDLPPQAAAAARAALPGGDLPHWT